VSHISRLLQKNEGGKEGWRWGREVGEEKGGKEEGEICSQRNDQIKLGTLTFWKTIQLDLIGITFHNILTIGLW
jgi:hypothetical protein